MKWPHCIISRQIGITGFLPPVIVYHHHRGRYVLLIIGVQQLSLWKFSFFPRVRIAERAGGTLRCARPSCAQGFRPACTQVMRAKITNKQLCVIEFRQSRHQVTAIVWDFEALDRRTCLTHLIVPHSECPRRDVAIEGIATAFESAVIYRNTNCGTMVSSSLANVVRALVWCFECWW